ncbi:hypothetical protein LTR74_017816 [Friedmanniomyces endolithicus]|nr:hypothetical protein LTR74_017816 [Friedmanniomyces endolithicus]
MDCGIEGHTRLRVQLAESCKLGKHASIIPSGNSVIERGMRWLAHIEEKFRIAVEHRRWRRLKTAKQAPTQTTKANPILLDGAEAKAKQSTGTGSETDQTMVLEGDNLYLSKKLEGLANADQRRRFLGAEHASTPYAVEVVYPNGTARSIQGSRDTKVASLIRAAHNALDLRPRESENPRLSFNGETVGHGMMLGELGILKDSKVIFTYDGVAEETEEL